ncbi:MAG: C-type lectin domain-containing protein [Myxococcota bacterium]
MMPLARRRSRAVVLAQTPRILILTVLLAPGCVAETSPLGDSPDLGASFPDLGPPDAGAPDLGAPDAGAPLPQIEYPPGCLPVDGYLFCLMPSVFSEARALCQSVGGGVIIIETPEENELVSEAFAQWSPVEFWMGLTDGVEEDQWVWDDGRSLGNYRGWNPGEPNDLENEDCSHNNFMFTGGWNDIDCLDRYAVVCEFAPGTQTTCFDNGDCLLSFGRCVEGSCRVNIP